MTKAMKSVYRLFNTDGDLLYIGVAKDPAVRIKHHKYTTSWGDQIARLQIDEPLPTAKAFRAERSAIIDEKPFHNVMYLEKIERKYRKNEPPENNNRMQEMLMECAVINEIHKRLPADQQEAFLTCNWNQWKAQNKSLLQEAESAVIKNDNNWKSKGFNGYEPVKGGAIEAGLYGPVRKRQ